MACSDPSAIAALELVAKLSPNDTDTLFELGTLYENSGAPGWSFADVTSTELPTLTKTALGLESAGVRHDAHETLARATAVERILAEARDQGNERLEQLAERYLRACEKGSRP